MPFTDLLRITVFLAGAEATVLGAITALTAGRETDTRTIIVAAVWWLAALVIGLRLGRPERAADGVRDALARAKTATSLPDETPSRIALSRLWPIGVTAVAAGVLGVFYPGVAAIGAGFALLAALAMRTHEAAVLGGRAARRCQVLRRPQLGPAPDRAGPHPGVRSDRRGLKMLIDGRWGGGGGGLEGVVGIEGVSGMVG